LNIFRVGLIVQLISFSCICSVAGCARFEVDTAQTEINYFFVCDAVLFGREISAFRSSVQVLLTLCSTAWRHFL